MSLVKFDPDTEINDVELLRLCALNDCFSLTKLERLGYRRRLKNKVFIKTQQVLEENLNIKPKDPYVFGCYNFVLQTSE